MSGAAEHCERCGGPKNSAFRFCARCAQLDPCGAMQAERVEQPKHAGARRGHLRLVFATPNLPNAIVDDREEWWRVWIDPLTISMLAEHPKITPAGRVCMMRCRDDGQRHMMTVRGSESEVLAQLGLTAPIRYGEKVIE